ncbi:DUF4190 domain-containing protein [Oceanobacillus halotolerans]|uniref:DUF4190 domain-containing protein n=1 Tax=Oceanobacillus halotolerans TaxID=2663380 RepID=UPI0013D9B2AF|nr:DUF4190 domain-containing protein [Oceanobacillus halotolerans]
MADEKNHHHNVEEAPNHGEEENKDIITTDLEDHQLEDIDPHSTRNEEIAAELTADDYEGTLEREENETETDTQVNSAVGWFALVLSLVSFFFMPIILGGAGIILGFISRNRGAETLGNTAIIAGAISILITMFVLPFV